MRRFASSIFMLLILILALWVLVVWHLGERTEAEFKQVLELNSLQSDEKLLGVELLSYRKNLLGADAELLVSSEIPIISERLGEFHITAKLFNGPLFVTKSGIDFGSSRWLLSLDEFSLDHDENENLKNIFLKGLPSASVLMGFNQKAHYSSNIDTQWFNSVTTGIYDFEFKSNIGTVDIDSFKYGALPDLLSAEKLQINYQLQKSHIDNYKPDSTSILIPELIINHKNLASPVIYSVNGNSNITINNSELSGSFKLKIKSYEPSIQVKTNPVERAQMSLLFKNISRDGFIKWYEAKADLDNLQRQSQWLLEEQGELPEGQDQIWQLHDRIDKITKKLPNTFKESVFNHGKTQIRFEAWTSNISGKSTWESNVQPTDTLPSSSHLSSFLQAQAIVTLDDLMYQFLTTYTPVNKKQFTLSFNNNQLLMQ